MDNLIELESEDQLTDHNKEGIVVIDFWAQWCMPCKMMLPILDSLAEENPDVTFIKINVDKHPEIAKRYGIRSIPQFTFMKDGEEVGKKLGQAPQAQMQEIIDTHKE